MNADILCQLLAKRISPEKFQVRGIDIHWMRDEYSTTENLVIVADVIANYDELAAAYIAKQGIIKQIYDLETLQTPRRVRETLNGTDNGWMVALEAQIAALRTQL